MPQQDTPIALCGKQINALFGDSVADEDKIVESPMRYAECCAVMASATKWQLRPHCADMRPAAVDTYSFAKVDKIASNISTSTG